MMNLYLLHENITNGFQSVSLNFVAIAAILSGIFVIVSKNPIVSVLFLIGLFLSISIYLMLLGINFIGLSYLLVYVGAISILFLFILMLINIRISEIVSSTSNSIPLAIAIGSLFFSTVYQALPIAETGNIFVKTIEELNKYFYNVYNTLLNVFNAKPNLVKSSKIEDLSLQHPDFVSSQGWDNMLAETSHINTLGNILYTSFPLWILLTSLILLLSMVGAILITLKNGALEANL